MIDEELYQKAADELNSERRRPHVWARACALANDDHDEARYLYTNLRVEELLIEAAAAANESRKGADRNAELSGLNELEFELEPIDFPSLSDDEPIASAHSGVDAHSAPLPDLPDDGSMHPISERSSMTFDLDESRPLDLDPDEVARLNAAEQQAIPTIDGQRRSDPTDPDPLVGTVDADRGETDRFDPPLERLEQDESDGTGAPAGSIGADDPHGSLAPGETTASDEPATAEVASGTDRPEMSSDADGSPAESPGAHEVEPAGTSDVTLGQAEVDERIVPDASAGSTVVEVEDGLDDTADVSDELADDLADRAAEPDGYAPADRTDARGPGDDLDWLDDEYRSEPRAPVVPHAAGLDAERDAFTREFERQADELPGLHGSGEIIAHGSVTGTASPTDLPPTVRDDAFVPTGDEPLELADGDSDREYAVFSRTGRRLQAVRQGNSLGALLFTLPWLLYRHLFGTAIVYVLFAVVALGGLLVTGLMWLEGDAATSLPTRIACVAFAALALVGLAIVPFRRANHWREDKLERRGFELIAYVRADSAARAIEVARKATSSAS